MSEGGPADAALARAHAAAGLELGRAPVALGPDGAEGDVFAAADDGFRGGEAHELGAEGEGFVDAAVEGDGRSMLLAKWASDAGTAAAPTGEGDGGEAEALKERGAGP